MPEPDEMRLTVPLGLSRRIRDLAAERGTDPLLVLAETVNAGLLSPSAPKSAAPTLDDAANLFLAHLPTTMVDLVRELCHEYAGRRPWQYLLSYCTLAHERGETAFFIGEADLAVMADSLNLLPDTRATCRRCGTEFPPVRRGQQYCSDECGRQAKLEERHHERPPDRTSLQHQLAAQHGHGR